ncbi:Putative 6-phosphogluconate dehydrogenase-like domain superfamily, ketopantoate reductase [Septoria linicola]|uniref:6-phosphogluconate dehydrogenase-like domain superfamily, ketopantoate reductase n=1 Tax=Septoria linicola TaxID=215465 RepID=A0A9Q9ARG8_9PEZI|nr:putative 6-phosphogluconate dehydrogenase-like domain superfamily, ketopantoate reductase [Septoria linicola]USW50833.1 Putative 6-phosphogluconate dehydrogenase-like domain superfamily, ketopantoate reductase [Septoria linicola]
MATEAKPQDQSIDHQGKEKIVPKAMEALRAAMSPADKQYAAQKNVPRRIHLLGTGSIGKLVAHSLRGIPDPPPVTLIFHRTKLLQAWERSKKVVTVQDGDFLVPRGGFDVELMPAAQRRHGVTMQEGKPDVYNLSDQTGMKPHEVAKIVADEQEQASRKEKEEKGKVGFKPIGAPEEEEGRKSLPGDYAKSDEPIHSLIVCTKTIRTIGALDALKHRISKDTTICFLQNGMGVIDDVNRDVFTDEATRPQYLQGIVSHGANVPPQKAIEDPFFVVHAGHGTIAVGAVPPKPSTPSKSSDRPPTPTGFGTENPGEMDEEKVNELQPTGRYITRTLTRTPVLACVAFTPLELLQLQLEKLAVNSILNPLTALLDNRNGTLLYNFALTRTMRLMLAETSLIIRSLPELRGIPNVPNRFSAERLETLVVSVANKTRNNISSMLADVRRGAQTEIEYINGYIIKRGEEMNIKAIVNYSMMQVVVGKALMAQREYQDEVPVEGKGRRTDLNRE